MVSKNILNLYLESGDYHETKSTDVANDQGSCVNPSDSSARITIVLCHVQVLYCEYCQGWGESC